MVTMKFSNLLQRPPRYVIACLLCSLGGFLFGIDTSIIGPVTVMDDFKQNVVGSPDPTIHGLIVSSILIPAAITSTFFAGRLADTVGRPRGIAIGTFVFGLGAAIEAAAVRVAMFVVGRVIEGIGEGLYLGIMIVYICEISPPRYRGALTTAPQLLTTLGLVTGFFTCYGTTNISSSLSWRLPFLLLAAYSCVFCVIALTILPASPRWLTLRGRSAEAFQTWEKLGVAPADREKMMHDQPETHVVDNVSNADTNHNSPGHTPANKLLEKHLARSQKTSMSELFAAESRPRLLLAVFIMGMQQLSGIDGVLYYAPLLFQQAGLSSNEATFLASGASAIVIFSVTIPATIFADRWGRRISTILGGIGMAITMFLIGGLYAGQAVHPNTGAGRWIVIICIYIYVVIFCISWAVGIRVYAAEIQPQRTRARATSIGHGFNWLSNFTVALITPTLLANTVFGAYFLFGSCLFVTAVVCWLFMPETKGKSLDEIDEAFHRSHVSGLNELAPWRTLRKLFRRRVPSGEDV